MFRFLASTLLLTVALGFGGAAYADVRASEKRLVPDTIELDGEEYSKEEIIYTFLKSSISTYMVGHRGILDDAQIPPFRKKEDTDDALLTPEGYRVQYPWLYEFMYREKGMPRYAAINKWSASKPVRVTLGFPNQLKPYELLRLPGKRETQTDSDAQKREPNMLVSSSLLELSVQQNINEKAAQMLQDEVKAFLPELSEATGLSLFYEDKMDTSVDAPRVHIVLTTRDDDPNLFKHARKRAVVMGGGVHSSSGRGHFFRSEIERYLTTAVNFTPYAEKQVDGYYLPNADNTIGLGFCFIWQGHPPEMLKALTRECLLRSMGLPDATALQSRGYLDLWGDAPKLPRRTKKPVIDTVKVGETDVPKEMSEYDRYFLRLLYSPVVKQGMSATEVYRALMER